MTATIDIRLGTAADAEGIAQVHFAAVHQIASVSYPVEILWIWALHPDEHQYSHGTMTG